MTQSISGKGFDDQDFVSIQNHAQKLEGRSLREIAAHAGSDDLLDIKGKGAAGQLLQVWFGLKPLDNRPEPDLPSVKLQDGSFVGIEIKAVPLALKQRGGWRVKERCKVTSIDYETLLGERWPGSRARHKLLYVLFIFYRYAGAERWAESIVEKVVWWRLDDSKVESTIREDWERTWKYVDKGRAHEISESQATILAASTAGAGHESKHVPQPKNPEISARKRAFSLKPAFLKTAFEYGIAPKRFVPLLDFRSGIKGEVLARLRKHMGRTLGDIANELRLPRTKAKHASALLVRRALGIHDDKKRIFELEAAGVKPKTIPVQEDGLRPLEAMSFPAMRLVEFAEEEWEESELRSQLDSLLFIPVFAEDRTQDPWLRRLASSFFWTPSGEEERGIAREWEAFRQEVLSGKAAYIRTNGKRISSLTPGSMTTYIHLRPKGKNGADDDVDPFGKPAQRLCFWLNQSFVHSLLERHLNR